MAVGSERADTPVAPWPDEDEVRRAFRIMPFESVEYVGGPKLGVAREPWVRGALAVALAVASSSFLFAALVLTIHSPDWKGALLVGTYAVVAMIGIALAPRYLLDGARFAITDRRVLVQSMGRVRSIDRRGIAFARIRWHATEVGVGRLELVRAVPFGPLLRKERLAFHDVERPDRLWAHLREVEPTSTTGDDEELEADLLRRLDADERVLWGGGPEGLRLSWRDLGITLLGLVMGFIAMRYALLTGSILVGFEEMGLPVGSLLWVLFAAATLVTFALLASIAAMLVWWGTVRARGEGSQTEYLVTNRRVLIRRGRTELSLDRNRIVDLAERPGFFGLRHVCFILDGPEARALGDHGALTGLLPSRDEVPPILYELRDIERLREVFARVSEVP